MIEMRKTASKVHRGTSLADGMNPAAAVVAEPAGIRSECSVETTTEIGLEAAAVAVVDVVAGNLSNFDSLEFANGKREEKMVLTLWTFDIFTL